MLFTFMSEQQRRDWITQVIKIKNDRVSGVKLNMTRYFESPLFIEKSTHSSVSTVVFFNAKAISVFVKIDIPELGLREALHYFVPGNAANLPGLQ